MENIYKKIERRVQGVLDQLQRIKEKTKLIKLQGWRKTIPKYLGKTTCYLPRQRHGFTNTIYIVFVTCKLISD